MNQHIFREYDIRGVVADDLTPDVVELLGKGIGTYMRQHGGKKIALGRDGRSSSPTLSGQLRAGLNSVGIDIVDIGTVPTPLTYWASHKLDVDGSIMITGSHNPPEYNGFKITLMKEAIYGSDILAIRDLINNNDFESGAGSYEALDIIDNYIDDLAGIIKLNRPVKLVVDCGNGVGGITAGKLLRKIGCEPKMLFEEVDGNFPNHHPDPTVKKNLEHLKAAVREGDFELGVAYDGDADRIGVVDEKGNVLWGDQILAILARALLEEEPGAKFIGEVKCSQLLFDDIENHGGSALMWKVGHSLIKSKMHEIGALLAGEMSGHIFYKHRFYGFDDAVYVTCRLLEIVSQTEKPVSRYLEDWPKLYNTPEIRRDCPDEIKFQVVEQVRDRFMGNGYDVVDVDGMRVKMDGGWGLLRSSNTQPVIVMRFEADSEARLAEIQSEVEAVVAEIESSLQ